MKYIVLFTLCALSFLRAEELTVETVTATRSLWPREVAVNVAHQVPIVVNGKSAGSMQIPAGRVYVVKTIDEKGVTVEASGTPMTFSAADTDLLTRAGQNKARLDAQAAATPPPAPVASTPPPAVTARSTPAPATTKIVEALSGDLVVSDGKKLKKFDASALGGKKYLAIYFSASWCPPCRGFTPELVSWYKRKKAANDQFDVIFVSNDRSEDAMAGYMKEDKMEWPALDFDKISRKNPLSKYAGKGIPCLVVIDGEGNVISDSYENGTYVGPTKVMKELDRLLKGS